MNCQCDMSVLCVHTQRARSSPYTHVNGRSDHHRFLYKHEERSLEYVFHLLRGRFLRSLHWRIIAAIASFRAELFRFMHEQDWPQQQKEVRLSRARFTVTLPVGFRNEQQDGYQTCTCLRSSSSNSSHVRLVGLLTNIIKTQNSHLHEAPPTDMNPATVGPKAGPANGAATKMAKAFPRSRVPQMSEITALSRYHSKYILR